MLATHVSHLGVSVPSGREQRVQEGQTVMAASLPAAEVSDVRLGDVSGTRTKKEGDEFC